MHWNLKAGRRKGFCLKSDERYRSTWNSVEEVQRSICPKAEAPDVSSIICEVRCLMWPLHRECKVILGLISGSLHRSLWNDNTLLKNIALCGGLKWINLIHITLCYWESYHADLQDNRRAQSWFFYNIFPLCFS